MTLLLGRKYIFVEIFYLESLFIQNVIVFIRGFFYRIQEIFCFL